MELKSKTPFIEATGVGFSFGESMILDDISFRVYEKERFTIIGPNGAGKTTLLKIIAKILKGARGSIKIKGKPYGEYGQKELARLIGFVPQANGGLFPYTVHQFTLMGRYPHISPFTSLKEKDERAVTEAMKMTEVEMFRDRTLNSLSGGERQRVFIAAALAQGATALLLDEPTTFLDPKAHDDILKTLEKVNEEMGVTVISVTHDINSAALWSHRILALKEGRVAIMGEPEKIMTGDALSKIYNKKFLFTKHPTTGGPMIVPDIKI